MSVPEMPSCPPVLSIALFALVLSAPLTLPAPAQQVLVQNGATLEVNNGAVWDLQGGTMNFGGAGATARLQETSQGRVAGGLLTAVRALNSPSSAHPAGLGAKVSASVNLGEVTITRGHTVQTGGGNESIRRYYDLEPSQNNSGLDASLTHTYADAELNGLTESNLVLFKSTDSGSTWLKKGANSRNTSANTVTLSGIESFSRWTLASEATPLPVELVRFEATRTETGGRQEAVRLTWTTASETGNTGFEIQRRVGGTSAPGTRNATGSASTGPWTPVGYRESMAPGGTTSEARTYRFRDEDLPYAADTLAYRLRQVDIDGSATLSDPVTVTRGEVVGLTLKDTYPNPASGRVTVRYAVPEQSDAADVTIHLYDVLGRQVRTVTTGAVGGRHEAQLSVQTLSSGIYVLRLRVGDVSKTRRLTVVR